MSEPTPNPSPTPQVPVQPLPTPLKPIPWWLLGSVVLVVVLAGFGVWWFFLSPQGQPLSVPSQVAGEPGAFISINADSSGTVTWYTPDTGLAVFPSSMLKDSKTAVVIAKQAGTYRLVAFASVKNKIYGPMVCKVVVGDIPPGPGPGPGPNPNPTDPFFTTLKAAFDQETDIQKISNIGQLAALYDTAAKMTINDQQLKTIADFQSKFEASVKSLLSDVAIPKVRAAIGVNLNSVLPRPVTTPLDASTRQIISSNFARIASDLEALK